MTPHTSSCFLRSVFPMLLLLSLYACRKEKMPKSPGDELPPVTQEGKGTFGCLINGRPFLPDISFVPPGLSYQYNWSTGFFYVRGFKRVREEDGQWLRDIKIGIYANFLETGSYLISQKSIVVDTSSVCGAQMIASNQFERIPVVTNGTVKITFLDRSRRIISGTFEFDAYDKACNDTVKITKGRFDLTIPN
jgi:hypothetical protein